MSTAQTPTYADGGQARPPRWFAVRVAAALIVLGTVAALVLRFSAEGTVTITSDPPEAQVWRDGQQLGSTPLRLTARFERQQGSLELRHEGFASQTVAYEVEPRQSAALHSVLVPLPPPVTTGRLELKSQPPGAAVLVDGTTRGTTPLVIDDLAAGSHRVVFSLTNYVEQTDEVTVVAGGTAQLEATLPPLPGTLAITSTPPQATVYVDGQERGQTPLQLTAVAVGTHEVKVVRRGYVDAQQSLSVAPNGLATADVTLTKKVVAQDLQRPIAVMVDNHPNAVPQAGLAEADIVYEALAEGGITRFMPIFMSNPAPQIGPVRSARHYFVYWAAEYNAVFAHCGGYPEAYDALAATGLADMDDLHGSPGFWRSSGRPAPHNLFTSTAKQRAEMERRGLKTEASGTGGLNFAAEPEVAGSPAKEITLYYPYDYSVTWQYDQANNNYLRFRAGSPHVDLTSSAQLRASNVIVLYMRNWFLARDDQQDFELTGTGKALFFLDGKMVEGKWSRPSLDQPTQYLTTAGEKVEFIWGGTTWIQVVPVDAKPAIE